MPEGTEEIEKQPEVEVPAPEPEKEPDATEPPVEEPDLDKEPGGADPQAVRARKEYLARKRAQEERDQEREERLRLEGEVKALRESGEKPKQEKIYTIAEVNAAVQLYESSNGEQGIPRAKADEYIDNVIIPHKIDERLKARETEQQRKAPLERARDTIAEYGKLIPGLGNERDPNYEKAARKVMELANQWGRNPKDPVTQVEALEMTFGSLDRLRKKAEIDNLNRERGGQMPVDAGAGGPRTPANGKVDLSRAPTDLVEFWNKFGPHDPAARETEYRLYLKQQQSPRTRAR